MRIIRSKLPDVPSPWIQVECAVPPAIAVATLDDRVSENNFDVEDEWAEMNIIARS